MADLTIEEVEAAIAKVEEANDLLNNELTFNNGKIDALNWALNELTEVDA